MSESLARRPQVPVTLKSSYRRRLLLPSPHHSGVPRTTLLITLEDILGAPQKLAAAAQLPMGYERSAKCVKVKPIDFFN